MNVMFEWKNIITCPPDQTLWWFPIHHAQAGPTWIGPCLLLCLHYWHSQSLLSHHTDFLHASRTHWALQSRHSYSCFLYPEIFPTFPNGLLSHFRHLSAKLPTYREFSCKHFKLTASQPYLWNFYPSSLFFTALVTT